MPVLEDVFSLADQVAVVTGAAGGLGRVFAYALAGAGTDVALFDINARGLNETAEHVRSLGRNAYTYTVDVADEIQVVAAFAELEKTVEHIDILVNNAGVGQAYQGMIHEYPSSEWHRLIDVNLNSVFYCSREALKQMVARRKGKIINISSIWGLVGGGFVAAAGYATTKGAVVNLTREMALEYAPYGIQINAICPGFHRTGLGNFDDPEFARLMTSHTPAGRIADADELRGTVIYLASSASSFMCGSIVAVDGGFLAQ
ncbi:MULTISPECIES: SDR family NAD(P)-dependent oxidoreductase [Sphingobium]|uniref:SDR family NAD(P)-dependent oxidoreductase n=1 Tax=Sphingobium TaxID=165695 RepID=UPI00159C5B25|nr:SDR family oxidoreductase [Sphingobium sp. 15-1]